MKEKGLRRIWLVNSIITTIQLQTTTLINRSYHIVSFNEEERIVIPEKFDFSDDFKYGFAPASMNNRYSIINTKLELILSCDYEYIEPLSAKRFKF